ncbi:hypothetical protein IFR05_000082 [Cadophora sp. M221]|nr:hypothetical protein IFR05_000082 [Cadophora sp. M221]
MHISRIVLVPALLGLANAFPTHPKTAAPTPQVQENVATKVFSEGYTSVVGDGEYTAIAHAGPTTYTFNADGTKVDKGAELVYLKQASPSSSTSWNTTTSSNVTIPSNTTTLSSTTESSNIPIDPLGDRVDRAAITSMFQSSVADYGFPDSSAVHSMTPAQQTMISNLITLHADLPPSDHALAATIIALLEQKIMHESNSTKVASQIEEAQTIVQGAIEDVFKVYGFDPAGDGKPVTIWGDDGDGSWDRTLITVSDDKSESNQAQEPASTHILDSRSPKKKKKTSKADTPPPTCPNGSPIPYTGIGDCPPPTKWQLAQQQDRELTRHLGRKEKADMKRDHKRIATTTFAAIGCAISRVFCPVLGVQGVI